MKLNKNNMKMNKINYRNKISRNLVLQKIKNKKFYK